MGTDLISRLLLANSSLEVFHTFLAKFFFFYGEIFSLDFQSLNFYESFT
jgi:hypothetical protein